MAFLMAGLPAASTYAALDQITLRRMGVDHIFFYDPSGYARNFCTLGTGECYIAGSTRDEKLWSGLRHVGFTPEQAAGIIGNIVNEGGTPVRQEQVYIDARKNGCLTKEGAPYDIYSDATNGQHHGECIEKYSKHYKGGKDVSGIGLGFVQWTSHNRRIGLLSVMEGLGLLKYFEGDAYLTYGQMNDAQLQAAIIAETGSDADYWALWCATIQYIYTEMTSSSYNAFFSKSSVEEYAAFTASKYEVCAECTPGKDSYDKRIESAKMFFQRYLDGEFDAVENGEASSGAKSDDNGSGNSESATGVSMQIKRTGSCSVPYNVLEADDALKIVSQFIIDTNNLYGTHYSVPTSLEIANKVLQTPNDDSRVVANTSVWNSWLANNIVTGSAPSFCWGGKYCGQCTALSGWFTTMLTGYKYGGGDGKDVVAKIAASNEGVEVTNIPVPFSVFSESSGSSHGHTGIIIGDYGDGTYLAVENNIQTHKLRAMRRSLTSFKNNNAKFAVLADKLKLNHIGQE